MQYDKTILASIKSLILEVAPEAKIFLFGSRATGKWHKESDWDILVIMPQKVSRDLKGKIRNYLFPLSVDIGSDLLRMVYLMQTGQRF